MSQRENHGGKRLKGPGGGTTSGQPQIERAEDGGGAAQPFEQDPVTTYTNVVRRWKTSEEVSGPNYENALLQLTAAQQHILQGKPLDQQARSSCDQIERTKDKLAKNK